MSLFPLDVPLVPHTVQRVSSVMGGITVTTGGVAHTKTGWIQLTPNTAADTYMVRLYVGATSSSGFDSSALLDVAIGNLNAEVPILSSLLIGNKKLSLNGGSAQPGVTTFDIPIFIPAGTRIAVRIQGALLSTAYQVSVDLFGVTSMLGTPITGAAIDSIGASLATSHGTAVASGVSSSVGAWTLLAASSSNPYRAFLFSVDGNGSAAMTAQNVTFDVGVGASPNEQSVLPTGYMQASASTAETLDIRTPTNHLLWLPKTVPAGTRLSVRAAVDGGSSQTYGFALYGVR